jgi:predicted metalloprotease with PDZ domain
MSSPHSSSKQDQSSSSQRYYFGPTRLLTKQIHLTSNNGTLDFTINGGNHIQPIQIESVVWDSQAYLQGIRPGDQIISVNGIPFQQNINYNQALQVRILYNSIYHSDALCGLLIRNEEKDFFRSLTLTHVER